MTALTPRIDQIESAADGNGLYNPEGLLLQRQEPTTLTAWSSLDYLADRWRCLTSAGTLQSERVEEPLVISGAGRSRYVLHLRKSGSSGFFGIYQPLENLDTHFYRGQTVTFSMRLRTVGTEVQQVRLTIVGWEGTADTLGNSGQPISSWGSSPTFNTNYIQYGTALASVTSAMSLASVTATVGANCNNLLLLVHTTSSEAVNDNLYVTQMQLNIGTRVLPYRSRPLAHEFAACKRYFTKSYPLNIAPGTANTPSHFRTRSDGSGVAVLCVSEVNMHRNPTVTIFNPSTGAQGSVNFIGQGAVSASVSVNNDFGFTIQTSAGAANTTVEAHYTANAEL